MGGQALREAYSGLEDFLEKSLTRAENDDTLEGVEGGEVRARWYRSGSVGSILLPGIGGRYAELAYSVVIGED